jgi:hypothetical protein
VTWQLCKALGVPFSAARCADEITAYDEYVATAMSEAERLYREAQAKEKG